MYNLKDNIVALATIPGKGALNVVRVSGPNQLSLIFKLLTTKKRLPRPNFSHPHYVYSKKGVVDQCIITYYKGPKSYTGENMLELSTHGGCVIANQIIEAVINSNARLAFPGEFTYRAFINNKINLIQAEAINGAIHSENSLDSHYQINNLKGGLSDIIENIYKKIKNLLVLAEHELDFMEGEITFTKSNEYLKRLALITKKIDRVIKFSCYENYKDLPRVVIVGRPNAGKSSLFNNIVGYNRAIVTDIKGTTRDVIEAKLNLNGNNIVLMDTAGMRTTKDKIEKLGIKKTTGEIELADFILVVDEEKPKEIIKTMKKTNPRAEWIGVLNKIDLKKKFSLQSDFQISCTKNSGIEKLLTVLSTKITGAYNKNYKNNRYLINERQLVLIKQTQGLVKEARQSYKTNKDLVILSFNLRRALMGLDDMLGPTENRDILNEIFGGFCVGK